MNIIQKIKDYQNNLDDEEKNSSIFLDLADNIIKDFPYRLNKKTYLLIPDPKKELIDTTYEYFFYNYKPMPISLTMDISKIMKKFTEVAEKLGFTVITKVTQYHNDGEIYDLLGIESKLVEEKTHDYIPLAKTPQTLSVNEYTQNPFLPVVFKNTTADRGEDIYLIENNEQLKKILALFELPESKKINLKNEFVVQKYIKGFEGMNTSIRVFTSCTGDILSSLMLVSTDSESKKRVKSYGIDIFNPCELLSNPNSPYYLNSKNIISNAAAGGRIISLNQEMNNLSFDDKFVLTLHDINIETLSLPEEIIQQCKEIATYWKTEKGIVLGIDFIYDHNNNTWYYLETNRNPSVEGYRYFMNLKGYIKKDVKALMQLDSLTKIVENTMNKNITIEKSKRK